MWLDITIKKIQLRTFFFFSFLIHKKKTMAVDSFFANSRKRKRPAKTTNTVQRNQKTQQKGRAAPVPKKKEESDIEEDEEEDHFNANVSADSEVESEDEEIKETAAEKRVRLAKAYLGNIEETLDGTIIIEYFFF